MFNGQLDGDVVLEAGSFDLRRFGGQEVKNILVRFLVAVDRQGLFKVLEHDRGLQAQELEDGLVVVGVDDVPGRPDALVRAVLFNLNELGPEFLEKRRRDVLVEVGGAIDRQVLKQDGQLLRPFARRFEFVGSADDFILLEEEEGRKKLEAPFDDSVKMTPCDNFATGVLESSIDSVLGMSGLATEVDKAGRNLTAKSTSFLLIGHEIAK